LQDLLTASVNYEKRLTFFVAIATFGRALGILGVAIFTKGMSFFFVKYDFGRGSITVADFAIFQFVCMSFVVESNVAVFGFKDNGVGGKGGAAGEGDEHGGNYEVFHGSFSCLLVNRLRGLSAVKKI
jgi:hypothetical protein